MEKLIVAIDFSKGSINALNYAISVANKTKASICLVWVDNHSEQETLIQQNLHELRKEAKESIQELITEYQPKLKHGKLTFKLRKGKVAPELASIAKIEDADLIIAGTHGGSGFEEFWIGSNANRIVMLAPCPTITVNNNFDINIGINTIVLPIDNTSDTKLKVPIAIRIAKLFDAEIHILGIYSTTLKSMHTRVDHYVSKVKKELDDNKIINVVELLHSNNPTTSTISYVDEIHADLIIIMTEQDASAQNRLLGQFAVQMVNHSPIPILSIHPVYG